MLYGWTMDYALLMPARRFFAMLRSGRKHHEQRMNKLYYEFSILTSLPNTTPQNATDIREYYSERALTEHEREMRERSRRMLERKVQEENERRAQSYKPRETAESLMSVLARAPH